MWGCVLVGKLHLTYFPRKYGSISNPLSAFRAKSCDEKFSQVSELNIIALKSLFKKSVFSLHS